MAYSIKHVANCFLQRDFEDRCPTITPMKLQKLVYCLHGWHLAITDQPAIDGHFEAWPYGPVEDELYRLFKSFRNQPITSYAMTGMGEEAQAYVVSDTKTEFHSILEFVVRKYMPFNALELSTMTHQKGTPWSIVRERRQQIIPNDLIKQHFRALVK